MLSISIFPIEKRYDPFEIILSNVELIQIAVGQFNETRELDDFFRIVYLLYPSFFLQGIMINGTTYSITNGNIVEGWNHESSKFSETILDQFITLLSNESEFSFQTKFRKMLIEIVKEDFSDDYQRHFPFLFRRVVNYQIVKNPKVEFVVVSEEKHLEECKKKEVEVDQEKHPLISHLFKESENIMILENDCICPDHYDCCGARFVLSGRLDNNGEEIASKIGCVAQDEKIFLEQLMDDLILRYDLVYDEKGKVSNIVRVGQGDAVYYNVRDKGQVSRVDVVVDKNSICLIEPRTIKGDAVQFLEQWIKVLWVRNVYKEYIQKENPKFMKNFQFVSNVIALGMRRGWVEELKFFEVKKDRGRQIRMNLIQGGVETNPGPITTELLAIIMASWTCIMVLAVSVTLYRICRCRWDIRLEEVNPLTQSEP